jgi:glyoxylase-like metal-dependent hydrolase (beta-lactamase superfamily II)
VYAVVRDGQAVLIDFGSGGILEQLPSIGVRKVGWILHTHFHRDQAQGDQLARNRSIQIAVPEAERKYFENVESLWNEKKVFDLYDMRDEFLAQRQNMAVDAGLQPEHVFSWNGIQLKPIATPGHTQDSLSFLYETAGKRLLFCGDLVASEGKIPTMHDLEWEYVGTSGLAAEIRSINNVRDIAPDILLPSHGSPSSDMLGWTPALLADLAKVYHEYDWINYALWRPSPGPVHLTKHIWQMRRTFSYGVGYLIVADSGHAFLWDVNAKEVSFLKDMEKIAGFKTIDFIIPSHYHDDHVGGINAAQKAYGTRLWAMDHMIDVLQHPMAYNLPCLWPAAMKVDRVLHDGEKVLWEGIPLQFFYLPGQTEYTEGMLIQVDGKKYLFDGDNVARPLPGTPLLGHFVCRNYQRLGGGHVYSAKKLLELKPDYVCPNHFEWSPATPEILGSYLRSSEEIQDIWGRIIDQPNPEIGVDNNWISFYPYQSEAEPGDTIEYQLRLRNWIYRPSEIKAMIKLPETWVASPGSLHISAPDRSESSARFQIRIPRSETRRNRRFVITADIWRDGEHLGELTETLVNITPMKAH